MIDPYQKPCSFPVVSLLKIIWLPINVLYSLYVPIDVAGSLKLELSKLCQVIKFILTRRPVFEITETEVISIIVA